MENWKCPECPNIIQSMTKPMWCPCCNFSGPGFVKVDAAGEPINE